MKIIVERTGRARYMASTEYDVTFPDGSKQRIWSPPWHDHNNREEDENALKYAQNLWDNKTVDLCDDCDPVKIHYAIDVWEVEMLKEKTLQMICAEGGKMTTREKLLELSNNDIDVALTLACNHIDSLYVELYKIDKFWSKIDMSKGKDSCWVWTKAQQGQGYGITWFMGKSMSAHKVAWILTNGLVPEGLEILHKCNNRLCCNPSHMRVDTHLENMHDRGNRKFIYDE
jgi:hypothetical protein